MTYNINVLLVWLTKLHPPFPVLLLRPPIQLVPLYGWGSSTRPLLYARSRGVHQGVHPNPYALTVKSEDLDKCEGRTSLMPSCRVPATSANRPPMFPGGLAAIPPSPHHRFGVSLDDRHLVLD